MKELYKEFGGAVFKSAIVVDVVCPADKKDVTQVMNLLNRQGITSGNSIKGWPRGKRAKQEVPYYAPFARILNTIVETFESFDSENRYYRGIRFYPYAKVMLNGTTNSFKPDIVSLFSKKESISHNVSWDEVVFTFEVKNDWKEMILQVGTYARCAFVAKENRIFVLILLFNHIAGEVRFCFYTRGGVICSPAFRLTTKSGFIRFVRGVIGIISWRNPHVAGIDPTRSNAYIYLPNWGLYVISNVICLCQSIRGRATHVYTLDEANSSSPTTTSSPPKAHHSHSIADARVITSSSGRSSHQLHGSVGSDSPNTRRQSGRRRFQESPVELVNNDLNTSAGSKALYHDMQTDSSASVYRRSTRIRNKRQRSDSPEETGLSKRRKPSTRSKTSNPNSDYLDWALVTPIRDFNVVIDQQYRPKSIETLDGVAPPTSLVIKDAWPLRTYCEADVFGPVQNQMGIVSIFGQYTVRHDGVEQTIDKLFPMKDLQLWDDFHEAPENLDVPIDYCLESRVHTRILFKTKGKDLHSAQGPLHLLTGIFHAMIGHYILYLSGWLHRDVSDGNILLLPVPEIREPPRGIKTIESLVKCFGVIADGDQAVRWRELHRRLSNTRSGTLPYMSTRLIGDWAKGELSLHTVIDDMESFFWVLLCAILKIGRTQNGLGQAESAILDRLFQEGKDDNDVQGLDGAKLRIIYDLDRELRQTDSDVRDRYPNLYVFAPILCSILAIRSKAESEVSSGLTHLRRSCAEDETYTTFLHDIGMKYYKRYFKVFSKYLPQLPEKWKDIVSN